MAPVGNPLSRKEMNNWKLTGCLRVPQKSHLLYSVIGNAWPYDPSRAEICRLALRRRLDRSEPYEGLTISQPQLMVRGHRIASRGLDYDPLTLS